MPTPQGLSDSREPLTLEFEPGFFSEASARGAVKRWKTGNRVRFKNGRPQKIGGWVSRPVAGAALKGVNRRDHEWTSLDGQNWIAQGTNKKLYLLNGETRHDITPVRLSLVLTNPFSTTIGLYVVTVAHTAHGAQVGDFVRYSGASAVGGITIDGEYEIATVPDGNSYTIVHSIAATSTAGPGGGSVTTNYDINIGLSSTEESSGWGTLVWGDSTWGTPRVTGSQLVNPLRVWSLANFGEDLIASPRDGAIYHWDRSTGTSARAVKLTNAPATNRRVLMSQTGKQIICLGAYDAVAAASDPMFIRVGDVGSLTDFTVTDNNNVFEKRLSHGSGIVTGLDARNGTYVFTDAALYLMTPSATDVFDVRAYATNNSIIGPNAAVEVNGVLYYMSHKKFMRFDGVLNEIPCGIWGHIFDDADSAEPGFNALQRDKVYCWHNQGFSEIWWQYPSRESDENDRCAIYNYEEQFWYYLAVGRTTGLTEGPSYKVPIALGVDGTLYLHETGVDDNTSPMNEFIESYDIELGDGKAEMHISSFVPDMKRILGTLRLTLKAKNRPQSATYVTSGPYPFTSTSEQVGTRAAGRQVAVQLGSTSLGTDWRLGSPSMYVQPDAERG